jgi:hydrogenase/urease accessory protein HupE
MLWFSPALAHKIRPAIITLEFSSSAKVEISIQANAEALLAGIDVKNKDTNDAPQVEIYNRLRQLPGVELQSKFKDFADDYSKGLSLQLSGQPVQWIYRGIDVPDIGDTRLSRKSVIHYRAEIPLGASVAVWSYAEKYGDAVVNFVQQGVAAKKTYWLVQGQPSPPYTLDKAVIPRSSSEVAIDYVGLGFLHILPKGVDHILFVLGLFLLSRKLRPLLWQVTAFTLAHSITLALSVYGVISLPSSIVEPLIALSIAFVGIENIITRELKPWRVVVVFLFGLLHGMGFAGVLTELGLPESEFVSALISFNVGVELGQLAVITLAFAAVFWLRNREQLYRRVVVIPGSLAIALMGLYWTWDRLDLSVLTN